MSDPNQPRPDDEDWGSDAPWGQQQPPPGQWQGGPAAPSPYPQQGGDPAHPAGQSIPNYLVHSIVATVLCCLPTGIVAIIYASQVNSKLAAGDVEGARKSSENAKIWTIVSVVLGLVGGVVYIVAVGSQA